MTAADTRPSWVREIDLACRLHPQLILTGNVRDVYLLDDPDGNRWEIAQSPSANGMLVPRD